MSEYKKMMARYAKTGSKDYSEGHQAVYNTIAEMTRGRRKTFLDIGAGIGWGMQRLLASKSCSLYVGFEPDNDSYQYCKGLSNAECIHLRGKAYNRMTAPERTFDYICLVEVIEHLSDDLAREVLECILENMRSDSVFIMSTPDSSKNQHGTRTKEEWIKLLTEVGFTAIVSSAQWTDIYLANKA